jgi:hypothetical protein
LTSTLATQLLPSRRFVASLRSCSLVAELPLLLLVHGTSVGAAVRRGTPACLPRTLKAAGTNIIASACKRQRKPLVPSQRSIHFNRRSGADRPKFTYT